MHALTLPLVVVPGQRFAYPETNSPAEFLGGFVL